MSQNTGDPNKSSTPKASAPASDDYDDEPVAKSAPAPTPAPKAESSDSGDSRAQDILAMIRNRQK
jgi:hypothetical protein